MFGPFLENFDRKIAVLGARFPSKLVCIGAKNGDLKIDQRGDPLRRQGVEFLRGGVRPSHAFAP